MTSTDVPPSGRAAAQAAFPPRFTAPLYLGAALNPVNSALIATALAPIASATGTPLGRTSVLVAALYLASAVGQPTAGRLAETLGARRVFVAGLILVLVGAVVGAVGSSLAQLVVARVLIGLGTATAYPTAMLLIRARATSAGLVEPPGGVLGGLAVAATVTAAAGLPLGGLLVGLLGWRSTFLVNLPVGLITLAATLRWVPRDEIAQAPSVRAITRRVDLIGIIGFGGALTAVLVFLLSLPSTSWPAVIVAAILTAGLVVWELRHPHPFLDLRLLTRRPALARTYLRFGMAMLGSYAVMYGMSQWLAAVRGLSPESAGLLLLPLTVVSAFVAAAISRSNQVRAPLVAAGTAAVVGAAGLLFLGRGSAVWQIVAVTVVFGFVAGAAGVANQVALYLQAPPEQLGTAAGLLRASGYLGSVGSSAITSVVFHDSVSDSGLHLLGECLLVAGALLLLLTLADRSAARTTTDPLGDRRHIVH